jgi:hypothetical protein
LARAENKLLSGWGFADLESGPNQLLQRTGHATDGYSCFEGPPRVSRPLSCAFGSRTVSYNPPRHSGVGFRRDF